MRCQPFGYVWVKLLFFFASSCSLDALLSISCISSALALLDVLKLRSSLSSVSFFDRTFLSHHRTLDVLCPATCGHQLCSRADTSCVLSEKINLIKINYLLFISILFYENQQTTLKFKVAPPSGRAFEGQVRHRRPL